jgi:hypothetical protein
MVLLRDLIALSVVPFVNTYGGEKYADNGLFYLEYDGRLSSMLGPDERVPYLPGIEKISRQTLRHYERGESVPKSVHAIEGLADDGILFPIMYGDRSFRKIIPLYSNMLFNGSIDKHFSPYFHVEDAASMRRLQEKSGLPLRFDGSTGNAVMENAGNPIGRLLYMMGIPKEHGRKSNSRIEAPIVSKILDLAKSGKLEDPQDESICRSMMSDFVGELFACKMSFGKKLTRLNLMGSKERKDAEDFGTLVKGFLDFALPDTDFDFQVERRMVQSGGRRWPLYTPRFRVSEEELDRMIRNYGDMIDFSFVPSRMSP